MFGRKPKLLLDLETDLNIKISGSYKDYYTLLNKRLNNFHEILQQFKSKRLAMINKDQEFGIHNFPINKLRTASRKVAIKYVVPLVIYKITDAPNYILMMLDGKILRGLFIHERLKPAIIRTSHGNVHNLVQLKQVMTLGNKLMEFQIKVKILLLLICRKIFLK